jgi:outer membrane cobalamin receptor
MTLSVVYFDQSFRDLIEYNGAPAPPDTLNYFNITGAAADGVEGQVRADLGRGWAATLRYTYLDTRVTDPGFDSSQTAAFVSGKRLLRRPADQASFRLHAPFGVGGTVVFDLQYTGDRDDIDFTTFTRVTLRGGVRMNLGAEYDFGLAQGLGLAVTARVENVLADDTRDVANYPARGRMVFLGGRVRAGR